MRSFDFEAAVVGNGPGGLMAALYLGRFKRSVAVFGYGEPRASWIPKTHNLLGFEDGISGDTLLKKMRLQASEVGAQLISDKVKIEVEGEGFLLRGEQGTTRAQNVIIATGITDIHPPIDNLVKLRENGVLRYCPVCDAYEYRDKKIVVLACDSHGLRSTLFLYRFSKDITVVATANCQFDEKSLLLASQRRIKIVYDDLVSIDCNSIGSKVEVELASGNRIVADVVYPALGFRVNDYAFKGLKELKRADNGCLIVEKKQRLQIPGLYAIGDCVDGLSQIAVAAGQAAIAATALHTDIRNLGYEREMYYIERSCQI